MERIVKAVVPEMPEDRKVKQTRDVMSWYKVIKHSKELMVPPIQVLRTNMMELDRFAEALKAFATSDLDAGCYMWDDQHVRAKDFVGTFCAGAIRALHQGLTGRNAVVACDIETRRVEWEDNKLLALGCAYSADEVVSFHDIPIAGASGYDQGGHDIETWQALQDFFADPTIKFTWHNGKFDCGRLKYLCNLDARVDEDTMLKHYVCINERRGTHGLKDLGRLYLQAPPWDDELDAIKREWCKQNKRSLKDFLYDDIPTHILVPYMQKDCIATYRLNELFDTLAREGSQFIYSQLVRASNVYMSVELAGQRIDLDYLEELEAELDKQVEVATKRMNAVAQKIWDPAYYAAATGAKAKLTDKFNPKSPKQLKWMLQELIGYPVPSTDAVTMQNLLVDVERGLIENEDAREFIESIGAVRKYSKYLETYALGMRGVVCRDARVRCTFNLHGTETGRLSSSNPNMQNIPRNKMIKNLLVATPGTKFLQLDYSQAELRVLAMLSEDPALIQVYQSGRDLHDAVADMMFGPDGHKDKELRNLAKTINFGIAYGRGPSSIAEKFGKSMAEARQIIDKWFAPMPGVKDFINNRRRMATRGEPCTTLLGRERHFVITNEELNHIQNEYINTPIQSLASDFTMLSLLDIHDYLQREHAGRARITTTVHDSIILEVEDGDPALMRDVANTCIRIMSETPLKYVPTCVVPFKADAELGYKWGDMHKMDLETGLEVQDEV